MTLNYNTMSASDNEDLDFLFASMILGELLSSSTIENQKMAQHVEVSNQMKELLLSKKNGFFFLVGLSVFVLSMWFWWQNQVYNLHGFFPIERKFICQNAYYFTIETQEYNFVLSCSEEEYNDIICDPNLSYYVEIEYHASTPSKGTLIEIDTREFIDNRFPHTHFMEDYDENI